MSEREIKPIRLMLVDDHKIVRVGLRTLLAGNERITVVGEAGTMAEAVAKATSLCPDVILMDLRLPDGNGVEACREIRAARPETRVLFLTSFHDDEAILATMFAGADGYLLKEIEDDGLIQAIETVARGQSILDPPVKQRMGALLQSLVDTATANKYGELSTQERRVLALVAEGQTNKEIAALLGVSEKTVRNHLSNVYDKLQVTGRSQAAAVFARRFPQNVGPGTFGPNR